MQEASVNTTEEETQKEQQSEPVVEEDSQESQEEPVVEEKSEEKEESVDEPEEPAEKSEEKSEEKAEEVEEILVKIFGLRTTANREDQVMDFLSSRLPKNPQFGVYSVIRAHGMRGYIFVEAKDRTGAEAAVNRVPYSRGILPNEIKYNEIEHLLEQVKVEYNILKNDIVELISGPFKRESAKVTRIDRTKEEVVVELLNAAIPIPITVKMDTVKVIRREGEKEE